MRSIDGVLAALDEVVDALAAVDLDLLDPPERFAVLERLETARRRQVAVSHALVARLEQFEGCPPVPITLADVLRISKREAKRRIRDAEQLAPRRALTGEPLAPLLPDTSKAWHAGHLDGEHLQVIQKFFRDLPDHVPSIEVEKAERSLAEKAAVLRPDQLEKVAHPKSGSTKQEPPKLPEPPAEPLLPAPAEHTALPAPRQAKAMSKFDIAACATGLLVVTVAYARALTK